MGGEEVVWDEHNHRHLSEDHPEQAITRHDVEQVMNDLYRIEEVIERSDRTYYGVIGRTPSGRLLFVACVRHDRGRYPVHARPAGRKLARRYYADDKAGQRVWAGGSPL